MLSIHEWLKKAQHAGITDIPFLLDSAPSELQACRGAWENENFSPLIQAIAAISFLEGATAPLPESHHWEGK